MGWVGELMGEVYGVGDSKINAVQADLRCFVSVIWPILLLLIRTVVYPQQLITLAVTKNLGMAHTPIFSPLYK
jgi:hypothetical protein